MKEIPLRARDGTVRAHALVSDEDFTRLGPLRWSLHPLGYAVRRERRAEAGGRRRGLVYLHREVLRLGRGGKLVVDHINRDPLDCQRENLRPIKKGYNSFANIQRWEDARRGGGPLVETRRQRPTSQPQGRRPDHSLPMIGLLPLAQLALLAIRAHGPEVRKAAYEEIGKRVRAVVKREGISPLADALATTSALLWDPHGGA